MLSQTRHSPQHSVHEAYLHVVTGACDFSEPYLGSRARIRSAPILPPRNSGFDIKETTITTPIYISSGIAKEAPTGILKPIIRGKRNLHHHHVNLQRKGHIPPLLRRLHLQHTHNHQRVAFPRPTFILTTAPPPRPPNPRPLPTHPNHHIHLHPPRCGIASQLRHRTNHARPDTIRRPPTIPRAREKRILFRQCYVQHGEGRSHRVHR